MISYDDNEKVDNSTQEVIEKEDVFSGLKQPEELLKVENQTK